MISTIVVFLTKLIEALIATILIPVLSKTCSFVLENPELRVYIYWKVFEFCYLKLVIKLTGIDGTVTPNSDGSVKAFIKEWIVTAQIFDNISKFLISCICGHWALIFILKPIVSRGMCLLSPWYAKKVKVE